MKNKFKFKKYILDNKEHYYRVTKIKKIKSDWENSSHDINLLPSCICGNNVKLVPAFNVNGKNKPHLRTYKGDIQLHSDDCVCKTGQVFTYIQNTKLNLYSNQLRYCFEKKKIGKKTECNVLDLTQKSLDANFTNFLRKNNTNLTVIKINDAFIQEISKNKIRDTENLKKALNFNDNWDFYSTWNFDQDGSLYLYKSNIDFVTDFEIIDKKYTTNIKKYNNIKIKIIATEHSLLRMQKLLTKKEVNLYSLISLTRKNSNNIPFEFNNFDVYSQEESSRNPLNTKNYIDLIQN